MREEGILHTQERIGKGGKPFKLYKVRTMNGVKDMRPDAVRARFTGSQTDAHRTTPLGSLLRLMGIDELPQIWNILRGEMSVVGIRPMPPEELGLLPDDLREFYLARDPGFMPPSKASSTVEGKIEDLRERMYFLQRLEALRAQGGIVESVLYATQYLVGRYLHRLQDPSHTDVVRAKITELVPSLGIDA